MLKKALLYEGKAKKIYLTDNSDFFWVEYKDDATAFNGAKKGTISNKGALNNRISAYFFRLLSGYGIESHFIEELSDREMLVKSLKIIPVEVVVRNIVAGSLSKRIGLIEGIRLSSTIVEYYFKSDELGDPLINEDHIRALNLASMEQMSKIKSVALKVNDILLHHLAARNLELVDFKLEFGLHNGQLLLGDEISPDTCRIWDKTTGEKLDKDRFRYDLGGVEVAYEEIYRRLLN